MKAGKIRGVALVLLATGAVTGAVAFAVGQLDQRERDWRAVVGLVADIERQLRNHDGGLWFLVEEGFPPGQSHPELEPIHEQLQGDLERLAHLDHARLVVEHVDVGGDTATVDYRIESRPTQADSHASHLSRELERPQGGQFTFRRGKERWAVSGHRFLEAPGQNTALPRPRSGLALWLGGIAAMALLLGAVLLLQPFVSGAPPPAGPLRESGDREPPQSGVSSS